MLRIWELKDSLFSAELVGEKKPLVFSMIQSFWGIKKMLKVEMAFGYPRIANPSKGNYLHRMIKIKNVYYKKVKNMFLKYIQINSKRKHTTNKRYIQKNLQTSAKSLKEKNYKKPSCGTYSLQSLHGQL